MRNWIRLVAEVKVVMTTLLVAMVVTTLLVVMVMVHGDH